ncbi:MAG: zinc-dependent metalloprotease [Flavobacteriales bacterium]|nr:zinc-dependent metalloprotease [Flavobacteriales bacterium]
MKTTLKLRFLALLSMTIPIASLGQDSAPEEYSECTVDVSDIDLEALNSRSFIGERIMASDGNCDVRVLVAYTAAAANKILTTSATRDIEIYVNRVIDSMNVAMNNSEVNHEFRLAAIVPVTLTENGKTMKEVKEQFRDLSRIKTIRNIVRADVNLILVDNKNNMTSPSSSSAGNAFVNAGASNAYASVDWSAAINNKSGEHELAHIYGCQHQDTDPDYAPYARGMNNPVDNIETIMSKVTTSKRQKVFSNPDINFPGYLKVAGTSSRNNVRRLNERQLTVASFREPEPVQELDQTVLTGASGYRNFIVVAKDRVVLKPGFVSGLAEMTVRTINRCTAAAMVSIDEPTDSQELVLFPNPNKGRMLIQAPFGNNEKVTIEIIDVLGKVVHQEAATISGNLQVDRPDLENGLYTVRVSSGEKVYTQRFVISK